MESESKQKGQLQVTAKGLEWIFIFVLQEKKNRSVDKILRRSSMKREAHEEAGRYNKVIRNGLTSRTKNKKVLLFTILECAVVAVFG